MTKQNKPIILVWSLTNRCNLSCSYCGLPHLDHSKELRGETLLNYLQAAINSGLRILSLTGGEPLLHPNIESFMQLASKNHVAISLNSNGILIEEKIDLIKKHCYEVVISWDGINDEHDLARGSGSSQKALKALEVLKANGVKTRANCVFTKHTYTRLGEIIKAAQDRQFTICFQPVWEKTLTSSEHSLGLKKEELISAIDFMINEKKKGNKTLGNTLSSLEYWKELVMAPKQVKCKAGQFFARVEPSGDLRKCGRVEEKIKYEDVLVAGLNTSFKNLLLFSECTTCHSWAGINANTLL